MAYVWEYFPRDIWSLQKDFTAVLGASSLTDYFGTLCCAGNLSLKATKEDLARHFGLDSTPYLRSSSWIELAVERPGASQGFGFINVPEHLAGTFY